jgi:hypothetical protein
VGSRQGRAKHVLIKRLNDVPCKGDVILLIRQGRAKHVLIKRLNDVPCKGDVILLIPM